MDDKTQGSTPAWPVHRARAQMAAVIDAAQNQGPQQITRGGRPVAYVVSVEEYRKRPSPWPGESLVAFLRRSPLADPELQAVLSQSRPSETLRDLDL